jgi:hypothetical protein
LSVIAKTFMDYLLVESVKLAVDINFPIKDDI